MQVHIVLLRSDRGAPRYHCLSDCLTGHVAPRAGDGDAAGRPEEGQPLGRHRAGGGGCCSREGAPAAAAAGHVSHIHLSALFTFLHLLETTSTSSLTSSPASPASAFHQFLPSVGFERGETPSQSPRTTHRSFAGLRRSSTNTNVFCSGKVSTQPFARLGTLIRAIVWTALRSEAAMVYAMLMHRLPDPKIITGTMLCCSRRRAPRYRASPPRWCFYGTWCATPCAPPPPPSSSQDCSSWIGREIARLSPHGRAGTQRASIAAAGAHDRGL